MIFYDVSRMLCFFFFIALIGFIVSFSSIVSSFIFCLDDISVGENRVLKLPPVGNYIGVMWEFLLDAVFTINE